jgi:archaemetzincin
MKRLAVITALFGALTMGPATGFEPPSKAESLQAIGPTDSLPEVLRRALDPGASFEPIPVPQTGDWLAVHREPGQTFEEFVSSHPNRPDKTRTEIYLQPLGEFGTDQSLLLERLRAFAAAYFCMEVTLLPPVGLDTSSLTTRVNSYTHKRQILTGDVLAVLKRHLPPDAFCELAITMEDLYPDPSWNFVFGQASLQDRVGVYSFARYDPAFYGDARGNDYQEVLLRRSCRVLAHETAHMFGLAHCIYYRCVLNGSNHLQESDARPLHLCPVCLHKLQWSIGFDVLARYEQLKRYYETAGLAREAEWIADRLAVIMRK